jgi:NAD(P)-dependent dehydrogenase (short-subunit alcohol dehydrogenase family)/acyl carrier protein
VRAGEIFLPRLAEAAAQRPDDLPGLLDPEGTVLITGGTGTLGSLLARHLITKHGARHVLLASRQGPAAEYATQLHSELSGLGASIQIEACDVADRADLAKLIDSIPASHPLTTIVHAAGAIADATVNSLSTAEIDVVLSPKVDAAWNLHQLTSHLSLSAFILFSSAAGIIGSAGQANYAAANAFLDALASHRRARGLPATSLAWGYWDPPSGMTGHLSQADRARLARTGIVPMNVDEALALFDVVWASADPVVVPIALSATALRAQAASGTLPAVARGLVRVPERYARAAENAASWRTRLDGATERERARLVNDLVQGTIATVLGHADRAFVDPCRTFKELGFDSLTAVEVRNQLGAATGLRLPATLVFDHPTPEAVGDFILRRLTSAGSADGTAVQSGLDQIERAVTEALLTDDAQREEVASRLKILLRRLDGIGHQSETATMISSATADEILDFIDKEFGDGDTLTRRT